MKTIWIHRHLWIKSPEMLLLQTDRSPRGDSELATGRGYLKSLSRVGAMAGFEGERIITPLAVA